MVFGTAEANESIQITTEEEVFGLLDGPEAVLQ